MKSATLNNFQIPKMTSTNDHRQQPPSDSDSDFDSDTDHGHTGSRPFCHADLSNSIFKAYFEYTNQSSPSTSDFNKIQSFLTSSSSGALSCLVCLERIKPSDPTWSCSSLCFAIYSSSYSQAPLLLIVSLILNLFTHDPSSIHDLYCIRKRDWVDAAVGKTST